MLEQLGSSVIFYAFYTEDGAGDTGLTVTVDVWEVTRAGTATEIVTGGNATAVGDGIYRYLLAAGSVDAEAEYIAVFKTADGDTDQQHIPALWAINRANVEDIDDILEDTGTTIPATITTIDNEIATIDENVDSILEDTGTTLDGKLDTIDGNVDDILEDTGTTLDNKIDTIDTNVDAILVDTGTTLDGKIDTIDGIVDDILEDTGTDIPASIATAQADLDNPDQYKADVSGLAPASEYDAELTAIQADLDNPDQYKADVSLLALEATLTEIKGAGWTVETLTALYAILEELLPPDAMVLP